MSATKIEIEVCAQDVPDNISVDASVKGPGKDGITIHVEGGDFYSTADALRVARAIDTVHTEALRIQAAVYGVTKKRRAPPADGRGEGGT